MLAVGVLIVAIGATFAMNRIGDDPTTAVGQEPVATEAVPDQEGTAEPEPGTPEPEPDPTAEPEPDPTAEPEPDPTAEPEPDPTQDATSVPVPEPEATPGARATADPDSTPTTTEPPVTEATMGPGPDAAEPTAGASATPPLPDNTATPGATPPPGPGSAPWAQVGDDGTGVHTLYVGTVGGPAREVITRDVPIAISGPVDGRVLAWWREGDSSIIVLVETADGSRTTVARPTDNLGYAASLDPSGRFIYTAPYAGGDRIAGLYRMSVEGGKPERLADGWGASVAVMIWSLDGRWLAISDANGPETVYRILDTRDDTMTIQRGSGIGDAFGFLGDELVGYLARGDGGITKYPLLALDVTTGKVRTVVEGDGGALGVIRPDMQGRPVLAYDMPDQDGQYTVRTTDGSGGSRLLYVSQDDFGAAIFGESGTRSLVKTDLWGGVESPGLVPVFTGGIPYVWPGGPNLEDPQRLMVGMETGEIVAFDVKEGQR
jgi:hypothetical protein